jgi:predicted acyl esterase
MKVEEDFTIAGPVDAHLSISTTGTDSDWIVNLIDEFPPDAPDPQGDDKLPAGVRMGGYQMMVRSEVVRGRYRDDPSKPKPFVPGEVTAVKVPLQDVLHTFKKGHNLMVHVQCTWFPLVDRNPQTFVPGVSVYETKADAFVKATQRVWKGSRLEYRVLPKENAPASAPK